MKTFGWIVAVLVVVFLFPKPYLLNPGFVSMEEQIRFEVEDMKHCAGFSVATNAEQAAADAPAKALCFGWLY